MKCEYCITENVKLFSETNHIPSHLVSRMHDKDPFIVKVIRYLNQFKQDQVFRYYLLVVDPLSWRPTGKIIFL